MAGKACHVLCSATRVGLTQALGLSDFRLKADIEMTRCCLLSLLILSTTGCATLESVSSTPPIAEFTSAKPDIAVAECIRDRWQRVPYRWAIYSAEIQTDDGGLRVVSPAGYAPWLMVRIQDGHLLLHALDVKKSYIKLRTTAINDCI
jgi:hypothetical protein